MGKNDKKAREVHQNNIRRVKKFSEVLDLPQEVLTNLPKISIIGKTDMLIENQKGIIEYGRSVIRLKTDAGVIKVSGKELVLLQMGLERMLIRGVINSIEYAE